MKTGKLPNKLLKDIILNELTRNRSEVILRPKIGEDCSVLDFGEYACVLSSDPITGTANEIGRLAVHVSCNDIASCGVEPIGLLVTILCPENATEQELRKITDQLNEACASINVDILGGHTEVTSAVNRFVLNCTAVGRCLNGEYISTSGAKAGDDLVLTKHAGLEGAAIIAFEKEAELTKAFGKDFVETAKSFMDDISVVKDGIISAKFGANSMHDVTEGGVLGAVWEMCEASKTGARIDLKSIPVSFQTKKICEYFNIDPLKLISSGCMLISTPDGEGLVKELSKHNIPAAIIGKIVKGEERVLVSDNNAESIEAPAEDELYKVV